MIILYNFKIRTNIFKLNLLCNMRKYTLFERIMYELNLQNTKLFLKKLYIFIVRCDD